MEHGEGNVDGAGSAQSPVGKREGWEVLKLEFQPFNATKACDPAVLLCVSQGATNYLQAARVIRGRVYGIGKCLFPHLELVIQPELDVSEKVFSGTRNP